MTHHDEVGPDIPDDAPQDRQEPAPGDAEASAVADPSAPGPVEPEVPVSEPSTEAGPHVDAEADTDADSAADDDSDDAAEDEDNAEDLATADRDEQQDPALDDLAPEERVRRAVRRWQGLLAALGGESAMSDLEAIAGVSLDLSSAHPGGLAQLLAGRPTRLGNLVREPSSLAQARRRARLVMEQALEHQQRYGVMATSVALGVVRWTEQVSSDGARVQMRAPAYLQPMTIEQTTGTDPVLTLSGSAALNPVVERALAAVDVETHTLLAATADRNVWESLNRVRAQVQEHLADATTEEVIVVGSFAHPGQVVADDLAGEWLQGHPVIAALAGDPEATASLDVPLPAYIPADRNPATERGIGDLDPAQQHALDAVAAGAHLVIDSPPGALTAETIAAIVSDAAASGRTVLHVPGTRRAAESLQAVLEGTGLRRLLLDASQGAASDGHRIGDEITTALAREAPSASPESVYVLRDEHRRLHGELRAQVEAWHRVSPTWQVSPHRVIQELAALTSTRPAPANEVRLGLNVLRHLHGSAREEARGELARAASLGAFLMRRPDSPWFGSRLRDGAHAREVIERVQRLAVRTLPALQQRMSVAASETGLRPARTMAEWLEQLRMLQGVRDALDVFRPVIFERSAADLVTATAPRGERDPEHAMPGSVRRRLRKQARDLLLPGRHVNDLHAELVAVQEQRQIWSHHCPGGGWPRLPSDMADLVAVSEEAHASLMELDAALRGTLADGSTELEHIEFDVISDHLLALAHDESVVRALPERTDALSALDAVGLQDLVADLARRRVPAEMATAEFDLAWWSSVLEQILSADPVLQRASQFSAEVSRWRELDRAHIASLVPPVAAAIVKHTRDVAIRHKGAARELFLEADEVRRGEASLDLRGMRDRYAPVTGAVHPCWSVPAMMLPQVVSHRDRVDLVILDSIQNLGVEQVIGAIGRARQVVLVADARRGGSGAVADLARILPRVQLDADRGEREEGLAAFLAHHGYEDALTCVPAPPGPSTIRLDVVDGSGLAVHGGVVESVPEEVEHVVELVIDHALRHPEKSLAVVALNSRHASRIREAVAQAIVGSVAVAEFFAPEAPEPFAVIDAEQCAGMRRDTVILAVGYGKTPHGRVIHQFGAISSPHGVSLLVDVLEAVRGSLVVTSCLTPQDLDPRRLRAPGSRLLQELLAFAAKDGRSPGTVPDREGTPDPLLVDLADRLWRMGLTVLADYGPPEGVRIPLVVGHPTLPEKYGIAVLTDTEDYVATASLRVRDRHWVERLERRGWDVVMLTSLEVFLDPDAAARRVLDTVAERARRLGVAQPTTPAILAPHLQEEDEQEEPVEPVVLQTPEVPVEPADSALAEDEVAEDEVEPVVLEEQEEPENPDGALEVGGDATVEEPWSQPALDMAEPDQAGTDGAGADEAGEHEAADAVPAASEAHAAAREVPPVLPDRAWEDSDQAWGDQAEDIDRLQRERPPHWE